MLTRQRHSVAVIGAGMAGATLAHALARNGHSVRVFDKARTPGGRLATRRVEWVDRQGHFATARLDHGALGFTASSPAFQAFADLARSVGWLAEWKPRLAPGSLPLEGGAMLYVPVPDMPALCRHLLDGVPVSLSFAVNGLHRGPPGWQVQADGVCHPSKFDAVGLALPPAQAAPLLKPHRLDWARHASTALAWVLRNDARPGRAAVPGQAHWVAHARPGWSRRQLEQPAALVQQQMQAALAKFVGRPIDWHRCTMHRWFYALPQVHATAPAPLAWWNAAQGLGVCGDFFGSSGVEGAWLSAQSLCTTMLRLAPDAGDAFTAAVDEAAVDSTHQAARRRVA